MDQYKNIPYSFSAFAEKDVLWIVTLIFVENLVKTLLGAKRVLKKEGLNYYLQSFKEAELGIIMKKKRYPFYSYATSYSFTEFKKILENCGLKINYIYETLVNYPCKPPNLESPIKISLENLYFNNLPGFVCLEMIP